ncbi:hypothetical protein MMC11_002348 [Xylographa trunciseda]|nr:hypothetical protein [Xylographa trunciseda]
MEPIRHGAGSIVFSNFNYVVGIIGLLFHPTCFEIFKKVSQFRLGNIDVEGLWYWYWHVPEGGSQEASIGLPHDYAVKNGTELLCQWQHEPGSEHLAANPIEIPGFVALFSEATAHRSYSGVVFPWDYKGPNNSHRTNHSTPPLTSDPFTKLSVELSTMLLAYLSSKDIANLRLSSPVFRPLPAMLFRRLLLEEMPWIWEARGLEVGKTNWYKLYCMLKSCWLFKGLQNRRRIWKDVEEVVRRIRKCRQEGKVGT